MIYYDKWLKYYKDIFFLSENQPEFFLERLKTFPEPAKYLDIECGPGLLVDSILKSNFPVDITVTDSIGGFIAQRTDKNEQTIQQVNAITTHPTDIAKRLSNQKFNVISCLNYRLVFLKNKAQILKLMFDAKTMLTENGFLILDLINFSKFDFSDEIITLPEKHNDDFHLISTIKKQKETLSYQLSQKFIIGKGFLKKTYDVVKDEIICPVSIESFALFAKEAKFSSIQYFSDYNGNAFTPDSDRIICVLEK